MAHAHFIAWARGRGLPLDRCSFSSCPAPSLTVSQLNLARRTPLDAPALTHRRCPRKLGSSAPGQSQTRILHHRLVPQCTCCRLWRKRFDRPAQTLQGWSGTTIARIVRPSLSWFWVVDGDLDRTHNKICVAGRVGVVRFPFSERYQRLARNLELVLMPTKEPIT
jgi:hypothetical protein